MIISYIRGEVVEMTGVVHEFPVLYQEVYQAQNLKPMERKCNLVVKGMCIGIRVKLNPGFTTCRGYNI